jgi:predicted DNA binding CopG/RHH family protein
MQQQTGFTPAPMAASSFAGILAALAAPESKRVPAWNDDDLEDDVATLSYEKALRAHARYRPVDAGIPAPMKTQTSDASSIPTSEVIPEEINRGQDAAFLEPGQTNQSNQADAAHSRPAASARERKLKCASITIRMSQSECAQLRTRATDAGLSISAYLRSCTFEAEALRAEVKEALAQLRPAEPAAKAQDSAPGKRSWFHWRTRAQA